MATQLATTYVADPMRYPSTFMPTNKTSVILDLEPVDDDVYQSVQRKTSVRRKHSMHKGFVLGHGIQAVQKDVGTEFAVSSIHGIFIGSVSKQRPVSYYLERLQNSNGCVARNVEGRQDGRIVFSGIASLTKASTQLLYAENNLNFLALKAIRHRRSTKRITTQNVQCANSRIPI